jgi:hypothetical protein
MVDGRGMYIGIIKRKEILLFLMKKVNLWKLTKSK